MMQEEQRWASTLSMQLPTFWQASPMWFARDSLANTPRHCRSEMIRMDRCSQVAKKQLDITRDSCYCRFQGANVFHYNTLRRMCWSMSNIPCCISHVGSWIPISIDQFPFLSKFDTCPSICLTGLGSLARPRPGGASLSRCQPVWLILAEGCRPERRLEPTRCLMPKARRS